MENHLSLRTHFGPGDDVIEVIHVHEVVTRVSPAHDQRHRGLVVLAGALAEQVAVEGSQRVRDGLPEVVSIQKICLFSYNSNSFILAFFLLNVWQCTPVHTNA